MGGQNVSCDFGGGKRTMERALQNQFWRPLKVGFAWSVPVSSKENNRAKTNGGGGGKRIIGGGVQNRFWEGVVWYVFLSPEFSTPLCFSLSKKLETTLASRWVHRVFLNLGFAKPMFCNSVLFTKTTGITKMTKTTQTATSKGVDCWIRGNHGKHGNDENHENPGCKT